MKKYQFLFAIITILALSRCSKKNELNAAFVNPETRNQEGSKLLGTSRTTDQSIQWKTFYYQANSNRVSEIIDSSLDLLDANSFPKEVSKTTYNYNSDGKLIQSVDVPSNRTYLYIYNTAGNLIETSFAPLGKTFYGYDGLGRITSDSTFNMLDNRFDTYNTYVYDAGNNIVETEEWEYKPGLNERIKIAHISLSYDDKANPYFNVKPAFIGATFTSNAHNFLTQIFNYTNPKTTLIRNFTNTYNSFGLPKSISWTEGGVTATDKYYYY